jgi:hypothetical protein
MIDPTNIPATEWLADLEISEAQAEAGDIVPGDIVPGEVVMAELRASLARLEARILDPSHSTEPACIIDPVYPTRRRAP